MMIVCTILQMTGVFKLTGWLMLLDSGVLMVE